MTRRHVYAGIAASVLPITVFAGIQTTDSAAGSTLEQTRPNIIVIMVDDAAASDLAAMPRTRSLLGARNGKGAVYTNFHTATPLCCPSRATLLTGQYSHNHGVWDNAPPHGGWDSLRPIEPTLLPVAMNRAGYQTSFLGKYANGYNKPTVPKGWDKWAGLFGRRTYNYWHFDLSIDGRAKRIDGYNTWNLGSRAVNQIRHRKSRDPLFMWLSFVAPHTTGGKDNRHVPAAPEYAGTSRVGLPSSLAVNEKDVSDKPPWIQQRPRMDADARRWAAGLRRQRQDALRSVDDQVQRVVSALKARGELRDTVLMFTSDNGYLLGQHRLVAHKRFPYTESTRVPLLVRGRGFGFRTGIHGVPVSNIDLAPTIAHLGKADLLRRPDGIDLRRAGPDRTLLVEHLKPYDLVGMPAYCAVRQHGDLYVEYQGGVRELYTVEDRWQRWNRAGNPAYNGRQQQLADRMAALGHCGGT